MELLIPLLSGLNPVTALFVFISCAEAIYIVRDLRRRSDEEIALRDKIDEMHESHNKIVTALQEQRLEDLKDLLDKYDNTSKAVVSALKKLSKGGKDG
jgi:DNA-binding FadR family transcriptional regulator